MRNILSRWLLPTLAFTAISHGAKAELARPPQYVLLAFDGSLNLSKWEQTRTLAKSLPLKFTYFISGVYYLNDKDSHQYHEPKNRGSAIGYGHSTQDVSDRVEETNDAFDEGNEIASHVCGHFSGSGFSTAQWEQEFASFNHLIFDVFDVNKIQLRSHGPSGLAFKKQDIVGFRAPLLDRSQGLSPTLTSHHFRYDTSRVSTSNYWPRKVDGLWNFPLADLTIAGTGKHTLSMDYNFYYAQSGGKENKSNSAVYEKQMLATYLRYFQNNYVGNRAPIHIGHHFSDWNAGAYYRALVTFAKTVCSLPEVKCITYKQLADNMDRMTDDQIKAYQAGAFPKMDSPKNVAFNTARSLDVSATLNPSANSIEARFTGADVNALVASGARVKWKLNGQAIAEGHTLPADAVKQSGKLSAVLVKNGQELSSSTRLVNVGAELAEGQSFELSSEDLEARGLKGDMPEAHDEQNAAAHQD